MKSSIFTLFVILSSAPFAEARVSIGNGGQIVECKNSDGSVESREAFDLFEGRALFGYAYPRDSATLDPAKLALQLASRMDRVQYAADATFQERVRYVLANMHFLPAGVGLQPTGDTEEFISLPTNCGFVQTINFRDNKRIYVNSDVWSVLTSLNKAAMYLHEAIYWYFRETGVEVDSRRTRKAVSYIMSGGALTPPNELPARVRTVQYCHSKLKNSDGDYNTKFFAFRPSEGKLVVQFLQIGGHRVITQTTLSGRVSGSELPIQKDLEQSQKLEGGVVSPIDIDAVLSLKWGRGRIVLSGMLQPNNGVYDPISCEDATVRP